MSHCRVDLSHCVFCAVISCTVLKLVLPGFCCSLFFVSPVLSCEYWLSSYSLFSKRGEKKIVFYWIKRCLLEPSPLGFSLGLLVIIAFLQPRCGFVLFCSFFSMFVFYFFSSVWEILLCTTTFYILERFQELADDFCLFVFKEKACFLTDLIFCNTSILKYRKENDIF